MCSPLAPEKSTVSRGSWRLPQSSSPVSPLPPAMSGIVGWRGVASQCWGEGGGGSAARGPVPQRHVSVWSVDHEAVQTDQQCSGQSAAERGWSVGTSTADGLASTSRIHMTSPQKNLCKTSAVMGIISLSFSWSVWVQITIRCASEQHVTCQLHGWKKRDVRQLASKEQVL